MLALNDVIHTLGEVITFNPDGFRCPTGLPAATPQGTNKYQEEPISSRNILMGSSGSNEISGIRSLYVSYSSSSTIHVLSELSATSVSKTLKSDRGYLCPLILSGDPAYHHCPGQLLRVSPARSCLQPDLTRPNTFNLKIKAWGPMNDKTRRLEGSQAVGCLRQPEILTNM